MNIILKPFNCCPHCYSDVFRYDYKRHEMYCADCGLVVANAVPTRTTEYIKQKEKEKKHLNHLKQYKELKPIIEEYERHKKRHI